MIVIVCGVSGVGKSTVGNLLASALDLPFYDADDFHPATNIEKMRRGQPLDEADRRPWLETLASRLPGWQDSGGAVLACSALRASYRTTLVSQLEEPVRWILLHADEAILADRMASRAGHFFDPGLLQSQLDTLEMPTDAWVVDARPSPRHIVERILARLTA